MAIPPREVTPGLPMALAGMWREHRAGVKAIAASPNGEYLASADTSRAIVVWRREIPVRRFDPFFFWEVFPSSRQVFDLAISNDSQTLFVAASDRLSAYALDSGRRLWRFRGPRVLAFLPSNPVGLAVNPAGGVLAAGFDDGHIGLWTPDGRPLGFWFDDQGPRRLAFTRDGAQMIGSDLYSTCIWDVATQTKVARQMSERKVHALAVSRFDDVAASRDLSEIVLWRHESGAELARVPVEPSLPLVAFSPAAPLLAFSSGRSVRVADFDGRSVAFAENHPHRPLSITFSASGADLFVGWSDGAISRYAVPPV